MKDEEMAEQFADGYATSDLDSDFRAYMFEASKDGFLAGLKVGRPHWHDLREDPNDLPNKELEEKQLLVRVRNYTEDCIFAYYMLDKYYSLDGKRFYSDINCDYPIDKKDVIAWCEIPTFDKE